MIGSRVQLSRVLDDLGSAVLEVLAAPTHLDPPVRDVTVYDADDEHSFVPGELVLGVGVRTPADIADLLTRLGAAHAAGLVVRTPGPVGADLRGVAYDSGVALLGLPRGARWLQVAALLRERVDAPALGRTGWTTDRDQVGGRGSTGSSGSSGVTGSNGDGDLFMVAGAVSTLLGAPVAIEDHTMRVLAHAVPRTVLRPTTAPAIATGASSTASTAVTVLSGGSVRPTAEPAGRPAPPRRDPPDGSEGARGTDLLDDTDEAWVAAILGRPAPPGYQRALEQQSARRRLSAGTDPIYLTNLGDGITPRLAVAVRAGGEVLGFLWAALHEPPTPRHQRVFADAARVAALHLLARRAGAQASRRLRADLLATLLEGGRGAAQAADRLGLVGVPLSVIAAAPLAADGAAGEVTRRRLTEALGLYLSAVHPQAAAVLVAGISYAVVPLPGSDPSRPAGTAGSGTAAGPNGASGSAGQNDDGYPVRIVREFLDRAGGHDGTVVGVGGPATSLPGVARSREQAERVLRVLRGGWNGKARPRVARLADLQLESLLLTLSDVLSEDDSPVSGPVATLLDYDVRHQTKFVETVLTWLDTFGNVNEAAAAVHVHPNTFRYRLRRLCEISGLDLDDPDQRLAVMLQLRLHRLAND